MCSVVAAKPQRRANESPRDAIQGPITIVPLQEELNLTKTPSGGGKKSDPLHHWAGIRKRILTYTCEPQF
jgi:hypothetical protein